LTLSIEAEFASTCPTSPGFQWGNQAYSSFQPKKPARESSILLMLEFSSFFSCLTTPVAALDP